MAQFFKINLLSDNVNGTSLVNFSDATLVQFTTSLSCNIFYGDIGNSTQGIMNLDGINSGIPVLMDSIQKAVEASPAGRIITLPSQISTVFYSGN